MKRPIVTLTFCLLALAALAQTSKGTISLGGAVGIRTDTEEVANQSFGVGEFKSTTLSFEPRAGYFLADRMELGLALSLSKSTQKFKPDDGDTQDGPTVSQAAFGPYFKYYMFMAEEKFAFTLNAALLLGSTRYSPPDEGEDIKGSSLQFTISPGFTYFFTNKIGLDFELQGIGFRSENENTDSDIENDKSTTFIFGVSSFSPSLGFNYYFGR